jgi:hypothetical protein
MLHWWRACFDDKSPPTMKLLYIILLVCVIFAVSGCAHSGYDKARFDQVQRTIDGSTNKLLGISLADASKLLSLDGVRWDEGYTSMSLGQSRIYHFRGFYLLLSLELFPKGSSPEHRPRSFSIDSEFRANGVWWVANFYPALHVDGLDDPKLRMSNYWAGVHASFRRTEKMWRRRSDTNK